MDSEVTNRTRLRAFGWFLLRLACNLAVAVVAVIVICYLIRIDHRWSLS